MALGSEMCDISSKVPTDFMYCSGARLPTETELNCPFDPSQ